MVKMRNKDADIIFYGELIKVGAILRTHNFRIFELFKGNSHSKSIKVTNTKEVFFIDPFKNDL